MNFPFAQSPDTATITCCHIIDGRSDILYVSHDDDGMWQFLCGELHNINDGKVVALKEIFTLDNSLEQIADLPCGYVAERKKINTEWIIHKR